MYAPRGFGWPEVGDVEVVPEGDALHLFHLTLPNHDAVQHAVSADGLAWRALPTALHTGDPGDCDDDMIWTMSVTASDGAYTMLYTALARAEDGRVQRTALATSTDLIHWTKSDRNPVAAPDARWYESDPAGKRMISWRDPKPIRVGETWYATLNAREREGPLLRRGCVGLIASPDLQTWEVRPPLFAPRRWWDIECPQVFALGNRYYLTAAVIEDRTQRYWSAPTFDGLYTVPPDGGILAPQGHYAGRICRWRDLDLYFCWHKAAYDWGGIANAAGKFVVAPLVLTERPDGSLSRRSFPGWDAYRERDPAPLAPSPTTLYRGAATDSAWRVTADGMDLLAADAPEHFSLFGSLTLEAASGGLGFRLNAQGAGYFITLTAETTEVTLAKVSTAPHEADGGPWFRHTVLQRGRLRTAVRQGMPLPFHLLVVGPYIECTLGDDVVLATLSAEWTTGRIGIWAESGAVHGADVQCAPMRVPVHK